jgi:hypothetical protein
MCGPEVRGLVIRVRCADRLHAEGEHGVRFGGTQDDDLLRGVETSTSPMALVTL